MHLEKHRRSAVISGNWITSADEPWIKEKRYGGRAKTTCRSRAARKIKSPTPLLSKRPKIRCPAVPICPKAVCGRLFCDDSVSDNDTPVLPNGGRPTEILPGVRVPWSGEASRRLFLRPVTWGSSVKCRCVKRD